MLVTILIFIAILGIVVLSHEFGHFIVAKKAGMRVEEFGFGFPPRLFGFKKGETLYSINLLPVGGFVKIFGEDGGERQDPKSFSSNSVFARSLVIVAGVVMNIILAYALFSASHMFGILTVVSSDEPLSGNVSDVAVYIVAVNAGSPASQGGLKAGDKITSLLADGERLSVSFVSEVQEFIEAN
ncbi:MAG: site-2 protease family protein, partial [Candidatus Spechtbacteria bacterium]|nr:site-2 protease family protein [Candidatus Spechtbacteria bacterium]